MLPKASNIPGMQEQIIHCQSMLCAKQSKVQDLIQALTSIKAGVLVSLRQ